MGSDLVPDRKTDESVVASWHRGIVASWRDLARGQIVKIVVGDGEPKRVLRPIYASEDAARRAACAALRASASGENQAAIILGVAGVRLFAGGVVRLADLRPDVAGPRSVARVEHRLADERTSQADLRGITDP